MGVSSWIVAAPLLAAVIILIIPRLSATFYRVIALLGVIASFILVFVGWSMFDFATREPQMVSGISNWFTLPLWNQSGLTIGLTFALDGLSLPLVTLTVFVALLALIIKNDAKRHSKSYYLWMSLAVTGVLGVFTAQDLFILILSIELALFSTFFMIFLFGGRNKRATAFKFLIYRGFASVALLVAFIGIAYGLAGAFATSGSTAGTLTFSIPALTAGLAKSTAQLSGAWRAGLFLVLLLGVFIEEAFVPFHTWLPSAHQEADTPTNMLLGGVLSKTGAYVLLRIGVGILPDEVHRFGVLIAVFGIINLLYGAFAAWSADGWRRLAAYGSISHMGLVLLGIASMTAAGLQGAMFMMVSSGLLTAMLFLLTGSIERRTSSSYLVDLGGLSKAMPIISGFLLFAALGSLGLPLTSGFISEIQAFIGGFTQFPAITFVGLLGLILSAVYLLYAIEKTTFGPVRDAYTRLSDASALEMLPNVVFIALVILIGVYPHVISQFFGLSVNTFLGIGG